MAAFRNYALYLPKGLSYSDSAVANGGGTASAVGTLEIAGGAAASGVGDALASGTLSISSSVTFSLAQSEISVEFT
jgi:hypothetical protein